MSEDSQQSSLDGQTATTIPTLDDVNESVSVGENAYKWYHVPIYEYFAELPEGEVVETGDIIRDAIHQGPKEDVEEIGESTKRSYISDVQRVDHSLSDRIIDTCPPGEVLLAKAMERTGDEINSDTLNDIQQTCSAIGEEAKQAYYQYCIGQYQNELDTSFIEEEGGISRDTLDSLLEDFAFIVVDDFPDRIASFGNSITSCGGTANELIAVSVLKERGLTQNVESERGDFTRKGTDSNEDIAVFRRDRTETLRVEVKSSAARERVSRALKDMDDPTALFAFLEDAEEVRNGVTGGTSGDDPWHENAIVAYIPPETIEGVQELDEAKSDDKMVHELELGGSLFLRANNLFAKDMQSYCDDGDLTDASPGHHTDYL
jgi:hypothetical protein